MQMLILMALRALGWLALAAVVFVPLERLFPATRGQAGERELGLNLGWFFINALVTLPLIALPAALLARALHHVLPPGLAAVDMLPRWARMVLAMVVGEVGFYWGHRWSHAWPWLWRFHAVHHSARHLDFLVNTRMHPVDMIFTRLCGLVLLIVTGLVTPTSGADNLMVTFVLLAGSLWSYFVHANVRWQLRPLTWLLATPLFHHWHHAYSDHRGSNFAAMLPVMDRVFGTYRLPGVWPDRYGAATPVPADLAGQILFPFTRAAASARAETGQSARNGK